MSKSLRGYKIGFIGLGDPCGSTFEWDVARFCQMEDVLMAVVDIAFAIDGLEVTRADGFALASFYGNGLHPVEGVLKGEKGFFSVGECE